MVFFFHFPHFVFVSIAVRALVTALFQHSTTTCTLLISRERGMYSKCFLLDRGQTLIVHAEKEKVIWIETRIMLRNFQNMTGWDAYVYMCECACKIHMSRWYQLGLKAPKAEKKSRNKKKKEQMIKEAGENNDDEDDEDDDEGGSEDDSSDDEEDEELLNMRRIEKENENSFGYIDDDG